MAKPTRTQNTLLLIAAGSIMALSVFATLYLNESIIGILAGGADKDEKYKHVTLTDALVECDNHARKALGGRLKALSVDSHSTRYDEMDKRFKVFMQAELYEGSDRKGLAKSFHVYCFSRGDRAEVATFKLIEDKDYKPTAIRKNEGGLFGWQ